MCNNCYFYMNISNISKENVHKLSNRVLDQNQNNNGIAEKLIPYSKEVLDDIELEKKYGFFDRDIRKDWEPRDWKEDGYTECPYKQLWYNWQYKNWWQKWWLCDIYLEWKDNNEGVQECCLSWRTPWWPEAPVVKKLSEVFDCDIEYCFEEPWMWFSWIYNYSKWELESEQDYNDSFYWHGKECPTCWAYCDDENEDDWLDDEHTRCIWCDEILDTNHLQHEQD